MGRAKIMGAVWSLMLIVIFMAGMMASESVAAEIWVTNIKSANVQVFDPTTLELVTTIPADKGAHNVTFSPNGKLAFIDVPQKKAVHTMLTGNGAMMAVFSSDGKYAYVTKAGDDNVSVVDIKRRREVQTIPAGKGVMAFEPAKSWRTAWVTGPDEDKVIIVDLVNWEKVGGIDVPGEPRISV